MEKLLIIGARDSDIAAIEVLCRMHWKNLQCVARKTGLLSRTFGSDSAEAAARHVIVDLVGLGLPNHSPANLEKLSRLLEGRPAVALTPTDGGRWQDACAEDPACQNIIWLKKPYKSMALREAIQQIMQNGSEHPANDAPKAPPPGPGPRITPPASKPPQPAGQADSIDRLIDAMPVLRSIKPLALIRDLAASTGPQHLVIGSVNVIIDYPAGWMATSLIQPSILLHVLRQPGQIDELRLSTWWSAQDIAEFLSQLDTRADSTRKPLDAFLWDLSAIAIKGITLKSRANLYFKLKYLPDFTQIDQVDPHDLRLATLCAKSPQSIRRLCAAMPGYDAEILRFVTLCTLAGLGVITDEAGDAATLARHPARTSANKERRSFLRKFLDKLS